MMRAVYPSCGFTWRSTGYAWKSATPKDLNRLIRVDNRHVDVLQLHRADTFACVLGDDDDNESNDDDVLLVKLSGCVVRDYASLAGIYRGCIRLDDKIDKYRVGYLNEYGYFCQHTAGRYYPHKFITFAQAYNSPAKMARPSDSGLLPSFLI